MHKNQTKRIALLLRKSLTVELILILLIPPVMAAATKCPDIPVLNWEPRSDWINVKTYGAKMESRKMTEEREKPTRFVVADFATLEPVSCPCGSTRRAFVDDPEKVASVHVVEIKKDSEVHYHKKLTETYYVLDGEGFMELDGERIPVKAGTAIRIKPGCRHRAVGLLRILNMVVPAFDPKDEWTD